MSWPTERAQEHIERLAAQRDIKVIWTDKHPQAYTRHNVAWCRKPTTGWSYLSALHELGHCASKHAKQWETRWERNPGMDGDIAELICEAFAWAWAAEKADPELVELIPKRERTTILTRGWGSYLFRAAETVAR